MNISLYTSTCKRKHEEAMKNMKNMKNPQAEVRGRWLRVFPVFHVLHVFQVNPRLACVVAGERQQVARDSHITRFSPGFLDAGNSSRPPRTVLRPS